MSRRWLLLPAMIVAVLMALPSAFASAASPGIALAVDDGFDWGFMYDQSGDFLDVGKTVTTTIRVANGLPGRNGYRMEKVRRHGWVKGTKKTLLFEDVNNGNNDDGSVGVKLPFQFPFFGIRYARASVSTNGWVGLGQPAWDYYPDSQTISDIQHFYRGILPYWSDLDLISLSGSFVKMVVNKSKGYVAFRWRIGSHNTGPPNPLRTFQAVLFRDGRIRFDYPGTNTPSEPGEDQEAVIGLSGARGNATYRPFAVDTLKVPNKSILFTPKRVKAQRTRRGQVLTTIPDGSVGTPNPFLSASSLCTETTAATATTSGTVRCAVPRLPVGAQRTFRVRWVAAEDIREYDFPTTLSVGGTTRTDIEQNRS